MSGRLELTKPFFWGFWRRTSSRFRSFCFFLQRQESFLKALAIQRNRYFEVEVTTIFKCEMHRQAVCTWKLDLVPFKPDNSTQATLTGTGWSWIFDLLKNLTGHFVHTEPFDTFAMFTRNCRAMLNFTTPRTTFIDTLYIRHHVPRKRHNNRENGRFWRSRVTENRHFGT